MSDSLNRKLITYPRPAIHKKVKAEAERHGVSVSKVIQNALNQYFQEDRKPATIRR